MQDTRGYANHAREYFSQLLDEMAKYTAFRSALQVSKISDPRNSMSGLLIERLQSSEGCRGREDCAGARVCPGR